MDPASGLLGAGSSCRRLLLVILACAGGFTGCLPAANREQLVKEVLASDTEFSAVLTKHRELMSRIKTYERELALKRSTIKQEVEQKRMALIAATRSTRQKIHETEHRMEPERQRLALELSMAGEELRRKREQRASLGRQIAPLRKALKNPNAGWSAQERLRQEADVETLLHDAARLDREMAILKQHIRLHKVKLLLIKL